MGPPFIFPKESRCAKLRWRRTLRDCLSKSEDIKINPSRRSLAFVGKPLGQPLGCLCGVAYDWRTLAVPTLCLSALLIEGTLCRAILLHPTGRTSLS